MNNLLRIVLGAIIADFLGINTRYLFFKIIGKEKTKEHLRGDDIKDDSLISQHVFNIIVGFLILFLIILLLMYLGV